MTLSVCTWGLLFVGLVLTRRLAAMERYGSKAGPVLVGLLLGGEFITRWANPDDSGLRLLTVLVICGFISWCVTFRERSDAFTWGAVAWIVGGLFAIGSTHDLVVMGLGWELVRHGVRLVTADAREPVQIEPQLLLSFGWWTAVAGLLLFAGTTDVSAIMQVARQTYWPTARDADPLGRASLLFVGSSALLVLSSVGAMIVSARSGTDGDASTQSRRSCGQLHLQWGAAWILATVFQTGVPGLSESLTVLLAVLILSQWGSSIQSLGRANRWGQFVDGVVRFHGALILCATWALMVPANGPKTMEGTLLSPSPVLLAWQMELLHGAVVITALIAATSFRGAGSETDYIEASRGAFETHPWSCLGTLLPLASLVGFPGLWGAWTHLTSGAVLLSVQSLRADELAIPVGSTIVILLGGLAAVSYLIRAGLHIVSVLCWEPLIGRPRPSGNGWPQIIAMVLGAVLVILGFAPQLLRWLMKAVAHAP